MMPKRFSQRKFLDFPIEKQHKKCAEILRKLYYLHSQDIFLHYNEIQAWMGRDSLIDPLPEAVSDRYHTHLQLSGTRINEHRLLPKVKQGDKTEPVRPPLPIVIYLDNIRSAHNVGSILRTVEAFALGEVVFSSKTPFIDHPQVQKTSMGTYAQVKCDRRDHFPKPLIALETCEGAIALDQFEFPEVFTLVLGNEEYGCSQSILAEADHIIQIPLFGRKNSLNVANAFAIAAAEISKQLS